MKSFLVAILMSISALPALAESHIKACGHLKWEETYEHHSSVYRYAVYASGFRFELVYLTTQQQSELSQLMQRARSQAPGVCIKGYFGGLFNWSGFDTGGVELSNLKIYRNAKSVYEFYQNDRE